MVVQLSPVTVGNGLVDSDRSLDRGSGDSRSIMYLNRRCSRMLVRGLSDRTYCSGVCRPRDHDRESNVGSVYLL